MRIVIVASYAPSLINFRGSLIAALIGAGHDVIACAPDASEDLVQTLHGMGASFIPIQLQRNGLNPWQDFSVMVNLIRLFRRLKPDQVLVYTIKPVIYGSLAAHIAGVPKITSIISGQGSMFTADTFKRHLVKALILLLYRLSLACNSVVFFQNPDDQEHFVQSRLVRSREKTVLVNGSGVDLNYFCPTSPVVEPITFLLMARLIEEKGLREYAEAAGHLKQRYPQVRFHLLGPFDTNPTAINPVTVQAWQELGWIDYLGETNDVRPFIAEASVYVLPSFYGEGTPRSILEAMAMARPIVTTDAPGCRETVLDGQNGYLVPVKDVTAMECAMECFIQFPELVISMGCRSRQIAEAKYDVNDVNAQMMKAMGAA